MKIVVTRIHQVEGTRGSSSSCPIALSLRDILQDDAVICITADQAIFGYIFSNKMSAIDLPHRARRFIYFYDQGLQDNGRFEFELEVPEEYLKVVEVSEPELMEQELELV